MDQEIIQALEVLYARARRYRVDRSRLDEEFGLYQTVTRKERVMPDHNYFRVTATGWEVMRVVTIQRHLDGSRSYVLVPENRAWVTEALPGKQPLIVVQANTAVFVFSREALKSNGFHIVT